MGIQWFPGHMAKSMRLLEENIKLVDCVLYILDARAPKSCLNPYFDSILGEKPLIYVLNKADLGHPARVAAWVEYLSGARNKAVAVNATTSRSVKDVVKLIAEVTAPVVERKAAKGVRFTPRAMVVGVPNCGKSTVINMLCGSGKTVTGDRPGVTRGKQWVRVGDTVDLLDTPGTLPKKFDDEVVARRLAYLGSVRDEVVDIVQLSLDLIADLTQYDPTLLAQKYEVKTSDRTPLEILEQIAKARGCLLPKNEIDFERAASFLINDFRKAKLGRITLEDCPRGKSD